MKKKKLIALTSVAAAVMCICGGIAAYYADGDIAVNEFTVGHVSLDLIEPEWTGKKTQIVPNEEFAKDPLILNDGVNDEYVFMTVTIPCASVVSHDISTGTSLNSGQARLTQLYTPGSNKGTATVDANWTLITSGTIQGKAISSTSSIWNASGTHGVYDSTNKTITYLYAYTGGDNTLTALKAGQFTTSLFDHVKFANLVSGSGVTAGEVTMKAYGIQTESLKDTVIDGTNNTTNNMNDVWTILNNQLPTNDDGVNQTTMPSDAKSQSNLNLVK